MLVNLIPYLLGDEDRLLTVSNFFFSVSTAEQTRQHGSLRGGAPPQHHCQQPPRLQSPSRRSHPRVRQPLRRLFLRTRLQMGQRRRQAHGGRLRSPRNVPSPSLFLSLRIFLLDGRLRSVDLYTQSDSSTKYQTNKQIDPDWRNRRWTEQSDKAAKQPVVTVSTVSTVECRTTRGDRRSARRIC